ncbi:hypothetical protein BRPE64_CCDS00300 [Caballeronia insecticola]|uniref:Uncharacterized protein n=1 Tax=Caballeronia insecticola TaxID=758793 RepID=R4WN94_9BURK|nr:hypothetical protein BRPE64_CCDS00300 [Caballeronia insecticola]
MFAVLRELAFVAAHLTMIAMFFAMLMAVVIAMVVVEIEIFCGCGASKGQGSDGKSNELDFHESLLSQLNGTTRRCVALFNGVLIFGVDHSP